jgi:peptidoglycan/LPS O-acetylase OafA/YrhL
MQRSELSSAQIAYLDAVRAAGAIMVLLGHAAHYFWPQSWMANGVMQGLGVYVFFLISGFLITLSVLQKLHSPTYGFGDYFADRFFRIYAALLPALVLVALMDFFIVGEPGYQWRRDYNLQTWIGNLLMFQDYPVFQILRRVGMPDAPWMIAPFGSGRPLWTISIEWWIYMLFGGIMFFCVRRRGRIAGLTILALVLVSIEPAYHFVGGFGQCLSMLWLAGSGAAFLFHYLPAVHAHVPALGHERLLKTGLGIAGIALLAMAVRWFANRFQVYELQFGLYLGFFLFGIFFALGAERVSVTAPLTRAAAALAAYSYSLYLTHHTVLEFVAVKRPDLVGGPAAFWGMVVACNLFAIAFWWAFERHHRILSRAARGWMARHSSQGSLVRS